MFYDISNSQQPKPLTCDEGKLRVKTASVRDPFYAATKLAIGALDAIFNAPAAYARYKQQRDLDLTAFTFARKFAGMANIQHPARMATEVFYRDCFSTLPANKGKFDFPQVLSYVADHYKELCHGYEAAEQERFCACIEKLLEGGAFDRAKKYAVEGLPAESATLQPLL